MVVSVKFKEGTLFIKQMQYDFSKSNQDENLMTIEELKASLIKKQKTERKKKSRSYIMEINNRYRKMSEDKNNNFFKNMNPFRKTA